MSSSSEICQGFSSLQSLCHLFCLPRVIRHSLNLLHVQWDTLKPTPAAFVELFPHVSLRWRVGKDYRDVMWILSLGPHTRKVWKCKAEEQAAMLCLKSRVNYQETWVKRVQEVRHKKVEAGEGWLERKASRKWENRRK